MSVPVEQCDDADAAARLPAYVRFHDLVDARVVSNWPALLRLIDDHGFPKGVMFGHNTRAWRLDEVQAWLACRPTARKIVPLAKKPRRRRAEEHETVK